MRFAGNPGIQNLQPIQSLDSVPPYEGGRGKLSPYGNIPWSIMAEYESSVAWSNYSHRTRFCKAQENFGKRLYLNKWKVLSFQTLQKHIIPYVKC